MFDKLRRAISEKASEVRESAGLPPDLTDVPPMAGGGLATIDLNVLGTYLGRDVELVGPITMLGGQATSLIGRRVQERLRAAGAGSDGLSPGELLPGQAAAREARLRAQGMTDEQIEMVRERIASTAAEHIRDGWEVTFGHGHRATVQLFAQGTDDASDFDRFESRWSRENGTDGHRPQDVPVLSATVQRVRGAPYECYCLTGKLAAKGPRHVAIAQSDRVGTMVLAGLATIVLRSAESA